MADDNIDASKPPAVREGDGVAMNGSYPHNHRLRAEALVKAGRKSDPDKLITDELIEDTKTRLAAQTKADAKAAADKAAATETKGA